MTVGWGRFGTNAGREARANGEQFPARVGRERNVGRSGWRWPACRAGNRGRTEGTSPEPVRRHVSGLRRPLTLGCNNLATIAGWKTRCTLLGALSFIAACTSTVPETEFSDVSDLVAERTGETVTWEPPADIAPDFEAKIETLLSEDLTAETAVQLALLNNPGLRATYADLGIGRAALVQAGLLRNPVFDAVFRLPGEEGGQTNLDLGLTFSVVEAVTIPVKQRIAESRLEAAKARVAGAAIDLIADTRRAFAEVQAAQQIAELLVQAEQAAEGSAGVAEALYKAGNVTRLALDSKRYFHEETKFSRRQAETELIEARERLNILLGLRQGAAWTQSARLPDLPDSEATGDLQGAALDASLELAAARSELLALGAAGGLEDIDAWLLGFEVGGMAERDNGEWERRPTVGLAFPIFDWGAARDARNRSEIVQAQDRYRAQRIEVATAARLLSARLDDARYAAKFYRDIALPLRFQMLDQAQRRYNAMQVGVFDILAAKRAQIATGMSYIAALRDYWFARSAVDQLLAGRLPPSRSGSASPAGAAARGPAEERH